MNCISRWPPAQTCLFYFILFFEVLERSLVWSCFKSRLFRPDWRKEWQHPALNLLDGVSFLLLLLLLLLLFLKYVEFVNVVPSAGSCTALLFADVQTPSENYETLSCQLLVLFPL